MRKVYAFVCAIALVGTTLAMLPHKNSQQGLKVGERIGDKQLEEMPGNSLVLVNFWASYDAASREENVRFSEVLGKHRNMEVASVSVSLDEYESLYQEIVKNDNLKFTKVMRADGFESNMARDFKLKNKFGNFLVDSRGNIVDKDITPEQLASRLNEN